MTSALRVGLPPPFVLCSWSEEAVGGFMAANGSTASSNTWSSANRAVFVPCELSDAYVCQQLGLSNGTIVSGNVDVGVYSETGTRLVSAGSTAQAGASTLQRFNVTDTDLAPGRYYLAAAIDNTTATVMLVAPGQLNLQRWGIFVMNSAFPLPSSATFAFPVSGQNLPAISLSNRSTW